VLCCCSAVSRSAWGPWTRKQASLQTKDFNAAKTGFGAVAAVSPPPWALDDGDVVATELQIYPPALWLRNQEYNSALLYVSVHE
jgi:hypothetical protein